MKDYLIRGASVDGEVRFFCCITTNLAEEARKIHDCFPVTAAALGRMLTVGSMMGAMLKSDNDRLTIQINGKGPAGTVAVSSNNTGNVKGYVVNPHVDIPSKLSGKLDVGGAIGVDGNLTVIKDLGLKEPYIGQIPIVSGEIGDDLTVYFANSEQIPTSVGLGVLVEPDGHVGASGGFILQLMPEATEETVAKLELNLIELYKKSISDLIANGMSAQGIAAELLRDIDFTVFETRDIQYVCDCSRDRIERALISMGEQEINDMIEEQGEAEVVCHFCNKKYHYTKQDLTDMLENAKA